MRNKLFDPDIAKICSYCVHGVKSAVEDEILCELRGIMKWDSTCRKYVYDPLKREPRTAPAMESFGEDDFKL